MVAGSPAEELIVANAPGKCKKGQSTMKLKPPVNKDNEYHLKCIVCISGCKHLRVQISRGATVQTIHSQGM